MDAKVTHRVVHAMGWLGLEVGDTVTLTIDGSTVTTDPPIGASQVQSALALGHLEPDVPPASVLCTATNCPLGLGQSEAAEWFAEMGHENGGQVAAMIYRSGGVVTRRSPLPCPPTPLRLVG